MSFLLSPIGNESQINANGAPLSGGMIETYIAGTSSPTFTYTDNTGNFPQENPIILNTLGLPPSPIWLSSQLLYKFIIKDSNGVVQRGDLDNIAGIAPALPPGVSQWVVFGGSPTFLTGTSFSLTGDQTNTFQPSRRVQTVNTGGTVYSTILTSVFSAGVTTITLSNDSGALDSGLSQVSYGILSATDSSIPATIPVQSYLTFTGVQEVTTSGTVPNYTASPSPAITSYVAGQRFRIKFHASGTVNPLTNFTINLNGLGAKNIIANNQGGGYVPAIIPGLLVDLEYDGIQFIMLNPVSGDERVGEIIDWAANYTPSYALLCNGAAVSRSTYCRLFVRISTTFGAGDGSTTFNLPNIPAGYATANSNGSNVGTATIGQVISHDHSTNARDGSTDGTLFAQSGASGTAFNITIGATGGSANYPAAMYMRKCIIF